MPEQRLKFLEEIGEKAQREWETFYNSPSIKALEKDAKEIVKITAPIIENYRTMNRPLFGVEKVMVIPTSRPVTRDDVEYLLSERFPESDKVEIFYTKNKILTRMIQRKKLSYQFDKDSKRERVFESILESGAMPTSMLKKTAKSPSDEALRKLVGDINRVVSSKLKTRIITFNRGKGGYAINENVTIIPE